MTGTQVLNIRYIVLFREHSPSSRVSFCGIALMIGAGSLALEHGKQGQFYRRNRLQ